LELKITDREIKAHASTVARGDIRRLYAGVRTWIAEPVLKRATLSERAEIKRENVKD
jgi:hypothetical protein